MNLLGKLRESLYPIYRPPVGGAKDMWIHHGVRAFIILAIAVIVPWFFPRAGVPEFDGIEPGDLARQTVDAEFEFEVPKNPQQLLSEQTEAQSSVFPILASEPWQADSSIARVQAFFSRIDSIQVSALAIALEDGLDPTESEELVEGGINEIVTEAGATYVTDDQLAFLTDQLRRERLGSEVVAAFEGLRQGVIRGRDVQNMTSGTVVIREGPDDRIEQLGTIMRMDEFYRNENARVTGRLSQVGIQLFNQLLLQLSEPTLRRDAEAIRQAREFRKNAVPTSSGFVMRDERIITENEIVGELDYQRLRAYSGELVKRGALGVSGVWYGLGMVLLLVSLLAILVFATFTFHRDIYEDIRSFTVLIGLVFIVLVVGGVVASTESSPALIPVAFAGLLAAALFDSLLGLVVIAVITGILLGQPQFDGLVVAMLSGAGGVTAAFTVRHVHTRSQSWILIATISGAYVVAGVILDMTGYYSFREVATTAFFGFANATACTAIAMGAVLPILETFTGRTTTQSLLELADMNRPLLKRLAREAPGTYAHSINMANLVEAACEAIDANSILGRVGVYYHDIGKLERPQYFIENQAKGLNPHDRLQPQQSAEILRGHVREGLRLADEANLPEIVQDFIREHHGTQKIRYFLEKATKGKGATDLDPNDFVYSGPKPQRKETAIAMLADAVESASRVLTDPSPERIRALIDRLVTDRVQQGELDQCGLTFRDLGRVKNEFAHVLTGLYHRRIDYPTPVVTESGTLSSRSIEDSNHTLIRPAGADSSLEVLEDLEEAQIAIDLDLAGHGDTGPPPQLDSPTESSDRVSDEDG